MSNRPVVGATVSHQQAVSRLPRRESTVYGAILGMALRDDPGQFAPYEIDVFQLSRSLGMKHDQVSDAITSIADRRFQVRMGERKVFDYPLFAIVGTHHRHMDKPMESVLVVFPHATSESDDASDEWTTGEVRDGRSE